MHSAFNLLDIGPFVVSFLCAADRLALRAANKEGRGVVDTAISALTLTARKPLGQFVKFVNGVLSRGARPAHLVLQHPDNSDGSGSLGTVDDLLKAASVQHPARTVRHSFTHATAVHSNMARAMAHT